MKSKSFIKAYKTIATKNNVALFTFLKLIAFIRLPTRKVARYRSDVPSRY